MPFLVTIPLLNPNETEALLAALHVREGQPVAAGDLLATLESTKSTADLTADQPGYVAGLRLAAGQTVQAGETLCYLAEQPGWTPPVDAAPPVAPSTPGGSPPPGLRITQPALALARQHGLVLERLPFDRLVTESLVRALLETPTPAPTAAAAPGPAFDPTALVIYGGGGHGKALIDLARLLGIYRLVGVLDDGLPAGQTVLGLPVLGGAAELPRLYAQGVRLALNAVGGIGNLQTRLRVFEKLAAAGFVCPAVVHPTAWIEASASLSPGVQVFAQAYVGSEARLGYGCIVNTGAIISHDCQVGDYANLSPGAILAGEVSIGAGALVGMGATINLRVSVGAAARLGNGATVKENVPERCVVPAGTIWPSHPPAPSPRMGGRGEVSHQARTAPSSSNPTSSLATEAKAGEPTKPDEAPPRWDISAELHRKMVETARQFRKEPTHSEAILWDALRARQLKGVKFRRQHPIGPFIVDFYAPSERLIVEVDGPIHANQQNADQDRQQILESLGLRVIRLSAQEVELDLPGALAQIKAALAPHPPAPSPHSGGRGAAN